MKPTVFKEASKIWKELTKEAHENNKVSAKTKQLQSELELQKKLLNFFQVGDYYYYIFNIVRTEFEVLSAEIESVLGYEPAEVDVPFFLSLIHPEDQPFFVAFEKRMVEFFKTLAKGEIIHYKFRFDYRIRKKDGKYIRILQQIVTIETDDNDIAIRVLGVHTDISHIKNEGNPVLSFVGLNGRPSYINVTAETPGCQMLPLFTKREKEILQLLIEGKTSDDISKELFISKHTVDSHRKNLLVKTNSTNTSTLISNAIKKGWL